MVTLIGTGCGNPDMITKEAQNVLQKAKKIIGFSRLLTDLSAEYSGKRVVCARIDEILSEILKDPEAETAVVFSGDSGFYSGAGKLSENLSDAGILYQILPGISSVQAFASAVGRPWQDWKLVSAHGKMIDPVAELMEHRPVLFLTGSQSAARLCQEIADAGLSEHSVMVGQNLSYENESIYTGTAGDAAKMEFSPLSVLFVETVAPSVYHPYRDEDFLRGKVPMTKQEIRSIIVSRLAPKRNEVVWDIGSGTGSVSIALAVTAGAVYAIESNPEACRLTNENKKRFSAWNIRVLEAMAPNGLLELPMPDAVFIGGSRGRLSDILHTVLSVNPEARICISAITLETQAEALSCLKKNGREAEMISIQISHSRSIGDRHMMEAKNPVSLLFSGA